MEKRRLGRTGLLVTAISFGALPLQRCTMEEAGEVLHAALDAGINFIDTARAYTDSEEKIGRHLAKRRQEFYLATKSAARTREAMAKDIDTSLKLLRTDYIDLYQVHNIRRRPDFETVMGPGGALEALKEAKAAGKIGHIGVTGHLPSLLVEAIKTGEFSTVQVPFNFIEREAMEELFPLAASLDVGRIAMKPLAGGLISDAAAALRFILAHDVSAAIPGMDRVEQVAINTAPARDGRRLSKEEAAALEREAEQLGKDFCRRCGYCLPCTAGIDIPLVFVFHLQYIRYGLTKAIPERYKNLSHHASDCIGCGVCETKCPYNVPIRERMAKVARDLDQMLAQNPAEA